MVAYISRIDYPDSAANSMQTIQMAAALAQLEQHTGLFVHDLSAPERVIRREYGIERSSLRFWPLRTRRWPAWIYKHAMLRFLTYNSGVAALLSVHPAWRKLPKQCKVLFVRSRLEIIYWGLLRPYLFWMRDWLFVCEIHDLPAGWIGAREKEAGGQISPEEEDAGTAGSAQRMLKALRSYDLVIAVNQALAEDLHQQTQGQIQARVTPLCSGLSRLPEPPVISLPEDRVIIGYFGTIDMAHGIQTAIQALDFLPERFLLRLAGRIRPNAQAWVEAGMQTGRVEWVEPIPYSQIVDEIDACHVALVPAGNSVHATRYRSPLKIFDAMLRGKAIVAADVSCHRELLCEGDNAVFYRNGDPQDLAARILGLTDNPQEMQRIARSAWESSAAYTYPQRAQALLMLIEETRRQRQHSQSGRWL